MELQAIASVIIGGSSIYGGAGAIWRSIAGVFLLALINNGFNIMNADPFLKDLTTGVIIIFAVAISAKSKLR
jgi:ribose transport system permease protein